MNSAKRAVLFEIIQSQPEYSEGKALVSPSEFFDGNTDIGSIGCNPTKHPGLNYFHQVIQSIQSLNRVTEVWMQIYDLESEWPFCENILIFGEISIEKIEQMTETLQPSSVSQHRIDWNPSRVKHLAGRSYINLWWD